MTATRAMTTRWARGLAVLAGLLAGGALAASPPASPHASMRAPSSPTAASAAAKAAVKAAPPVDVNSADRVQLKRLPGIGDAEAERIVAGRPYRSKADLVTRQVLPAGVFQTIRHQIVAVQKKVPARPRAGPAATASGAR